MLKHFPIGLGTARFPVNGPKDTDGFEKSVELVCRAISDGVDYIDSSDTYAGGLAQSIIREAFKRSGKKVATTLKCNYENDKTYDAAMRRAESQLTALGIDSAEYFLAWTIKSLADFKKIIQKGGMYDAALKLKDDKVINGICFSTHAPVADTIQILKSGMFDGMTISYSLLNGVSAQPALDTALDLDIDVVVMNPLGGGIIPQNNEYFDFALMSNDTSVVQSALRYCFAHPAVKIVLCGAQSIAELDENMGAVAANDENMAARTVHVNTAAKSLDGFCTGCRYCEGCPVGIPTANYMQARNTLLFKPTNSYNRTEHEVVKNIDLFKSLFYDYGIRIGQPDNLLDVEKNPCIGCGKCNDRCTQHLDIQKSIENIFTRAQKSCFTLYGAKQRFMELFCDNPKRVGVIPSGNYAANMLDLYKRIFGDLPFEVFAFNNNASTWGTEFCGTKVLNPSEIPNLSLDLLLVSNYIHGEGIYSGIRQYEGNGLKIKRVYSQTDVPWFY